MVPKVTVIIPSYNMGHMLVEAVQSLLGQTYQDWNAIVVDDGSEDDTRRLMGPFLSDRISYVWQPNAGVAAALNTGLAQASSAYISFLAADDLLLPDAMEQQARVLDAHADVALVFGQAYEIDPSGNIWGTRVPFGAETLNVLASSESVPRLLKKNFIICSTVMLRQSFVEGTGTFDASLDTGGEDWEFYLRLAARGPIAYLPRPLAKYLIHDGSLTARLAVTPKGESDRQRMLDTFFAGPDVQRLFGHLERMAQAYLHYHFSQLAASRRQKRAAVRHFVKATYLRPQLWMGAGGWSMAYALTKAFLPAWLVQAARLTRRMIGRDRLHHGVALAYRSDRASRGLSGGPRG